MKNLQFLVLCLFLLGACGVGTPIATLSAVALGFGTQDLNVQTDPLNLVVGNVGTATLLITSITASDQFGETDTCHGQVKPKATCNISVTFTPTHAVFAVGTLTIVDNAKDSPQIVALTGTGTSGGGACTPGGQACAIRPCCSGFHCVAATTRASCFPD
jgi:hypothetical protein